MKSSENTDKAIPILPSRNIEATAAFYRSIGFVGHAHEFDAGYAIMERSSGSGQLELHFFRHETLVPEDSWAGCYLRVADVEELYRAALSLGLPQHGIPRVVSLEDKPWGMREFAVVDPDGNLLRIGMALPES